MNDQLMTVMQISNYRGCLLTKTKDGFKILGRDCKDMKEVDEILDAAFTGFSNNIIQQKQIQ